MTAPVPATTVDDGSDPAELASFDADQQHIWGEQKAIYAAFLAGDRARIDRWIHPTATIWDSVAEPIARGLDDLNKIRATRPVGAAAAVVTAMTVDSPVITVFGDSAFGRHVLRVTESKPDGSASTEVMRVSSGWHKFDGDWFIVHSHEDVFSVTAV
jgi:ketosteroid isomerase-like protein